MFCLQPFNLILVWLNIVLSLAIICVNVYLIVYLQCRKKALQALDDSLILVQNLRIATAYAEIPITGVVLLCESVNIEPSVVILEYKLDAFHRETSIYQTFGITEVLSGRHKSKAMMFYKELVDRFINWEQNVYVRNGRFGERLLNEAYGDQLQT